MIPTVAQVYTATRSVLGDDQQAAGQVFTDAILQPKYIAAYAELFRAMQGGQNPRIRQEAYFNVPINTGYLDPATAGIDSLGEIETIEERGGLTSWAVSNVVASAGTALVTSAATTLVTGNQAVLYGVGGITEDINGIWTVTALSPTSTQLNGSTATGTYTSGGVLSYSAEEFLTMSPVQRIDWVDRTPTSAFLCYAWERDIIRFPPADNIRQVRITYSLSGDAPTTTTASTGIDDALDFLMYRIAGLAAESKGMLTRAAIYNLRACGPKWESESIPGGLLGQLLSSGVRNAQRLPPSQRRPPAFGWNRRRRWLVW